MKKTILCGSILSILSTTAFANLYDHQAREDASNAMTLAVNMANQQFAEAASTQQPSTSQPASTQTPTPATPAAQSAVTPPPSPVPAPEPSNQPINCNYHIPAETTDIPQATLLTWAEKATQQSFQFDHKKFNEQLEALKACYTEQGWQSYTDALQKSGNDKAIQSQSLTVTSVIDGKPTISEMQKNQWKVSLPLQVTYQNDKEKLTQPLTIDLLIGRKTSGDLGIMQLIASPRHPAMNSSANTNGSVTQ